MLVGGGSERGVVCAASYEARAYGCHSAQPMAAARRLCPDAVVIRPRGARYREVSEVVFRVLHATTPQVEPLGLDEAFLDISGLVPRHGTPGEIGARLRGSVREATGLAATVGVAPTKFAAKLASSTSKPDGLLVVGPDELSDWLAAHPIEAMWGLGPARARFFREHGVTTFGALQQWETPALVRRFGHRALAWQELARGVDRRGVTPDRERRSVSHEQTFRVDVGDREELRRIVFEQTEHVARRLRRHDLRAERVTVKLRDGGFRTLTRSTTLGQPSASTDVLWAAVRERFGVWADRAFVPLRLSGGAAEVSRNAPQHLLFGDEGGSGRPAVDAVTDRIVARFGAGAIGRAGQHRAEDEATSQGDVNTI